MELCFILKYDKKVYFFYKMNKKFLDWFYI